MLRNYAVHSKSTLSDLAPMYLDYYKAKSSKSRSIGYSYPGKAVRSYSAKEIAEMGIELFFKVRKIFLHK